MIWKDVAKVAVRIQVGYLLQCVPLQREDLGACSKIHSEAMRGDYEKASQKADYNMEEEVSTEWRGRERKGREEVRVEGGKMEGGSGYNRGKGRGVLWLVV